jgi:hypothetical protein
MTSGAATFSATLLDVARARHPVLLVDSKDSAPSAEESS